MTCWRTGTRSIRRQPAHHPARHLRHRGLPRKRARLAGPMDRHPHRQRRPGAGAETAINWWKSRGEDPAREAGDLLRRARRRQDRDAARPVRGPRAGELRLGHAADERLPRAGGGRRAGAVLAGVQGCRSERAADGEAVATTRRRRWARRRRSRGTSGCSGWASRNGWRWWFRPCSAHRRAACSYSTGVIRSRSRNFLKMNSRLTLKSCANSRAVASVGGLLAKISSNVFSGTRRHAAIRLQMISIRRSSPASSSTNPSPVLSTPLV
jgi:hypothetical protein